MSGGARYWNEETQRWEDTDGQDTSSAPVTPPPPARPGFAPAEGAPGADEAPSPPASPTAPAGWHTPVGAGDGAWSPTEVSGGAPALPAPGAAGVGAGPAAPWPGASWPPVGQPAAPAPARGMSRRLVWSVVIAAAVVGVAVSLVLTVVVPSGDDKDGPTVAASGSESSPPTEVSQQSDPGPTLTEETVSPSTPAPTLPAEYESYEDKEGFRIALPKGWTRSTKASQYGIPIVNYRSADGERRLQIYQVSEPSPDASFDLYLSDRTAKAAGFDELSLENLDDGEFTGSRLEYLADRIKGEPDVGTWHVYDERFVAADGNIYAIAAYGPDSDGREDELELLTTALDNFCPPYACDPASID